MTSSEQGGDLWPALSRVSPKLHLATSKLLPEFQPDLKI